MRKLMIMLAMIVGFAGQGTEVANEVSGIIVDTNEVSVVVNQVVNEEITGIVESFPDGDTVIEYTDYSSVLYNRRDNLYIMWLPETEDFEHHYNSYEELMTAIEKYHTANNRVVTDIININEKNISALNPKGYSKVAEVLDRIDAEVLSLLARTDLRIYYSNDVIEKHEDNINLAEDRMVLGYYHNVYNYIVMREDYGSIEGALIHEIGHALDNNLGLRNNQTIIDSYMNHEVTFTNANNSDYYYSSVAEYIAQSIAEYYNGTLDKDTVMYQELDYILGK